ncbi:hypothetical protein I6F37_39820, partial [Bradyrhizobium sp. NBAIM08]|nr:hypothetical protein [Bradyrhizobium sp. NBAIM08]
DIHHVSGSVDPVRDIEVITTELVLADLGACQKRLDKTQKQARSGDKLAKAEVALIEKLLPHLDQGKPASVLPLSDDESTLLKSFFLLTAKPVLFACNVLEGELAAATAALESDEITPEGVAAASVRAVKKFVGSQLATEAVVISAQI